MWNENDKGGDMDCPSPDKLGYFTDDQLIGELSKRETMRKEAAKDRSNRVFYRRASGEFYTLKAKAKFLETLTDGQQNTIIESRHLLFYLDQETDAERDIRLTRTASYIEDFDGAWMCFYEENGAPVFQQVEQTLREAKEKTGRWENDADWWQQGYKGEYKGYSAWTILERYR